MLDPGLQDPEKIAKVTDGVRPPLLGIRAVSTAVNRVGTQGPELIDPRPTTTDRELPPSLVA